MNDVDLVSVANKLLRQSQAVDCVPAETVGWVENRDHAESKRARFDRFLIAGTANCRRHGVVRKCGAASRDRTSSPRLRQAPKLC